MTSPARPWRRWAGDLDWILFAAAGALSILGTVVVWSATGADIAPGGDSAAVAKRQAISVAMGLVLALAAARIPYPLLRAYAPVAYVVGVIGLLLPFTPLGTAIAGARAWITLPGGLSLQPSEFAKIAMVLGMATALAVSLRRSEAPTDRQVMQGLLLAGPPVALVLVQNDTGTMLVLAATAFAIVVLSGARTRLIAALGAGAFIVALAVVRLGVLKQYQVDRLTAFVDPQANAETIGYNTQQARIAIGGGGLFGHGLFQGPQTQGSFVPVNDSDFIFTVVVEELGLLGAGVVLGMIAVLLWRGFRIAAMAPDMFGRLTAAGIVAWWLFQSFENVGMTLGIMPVTGVTLPLVSYGGSSVMATWLAIGLLQAIHIRSHAR